LESVDAAIATTTSVTESLAGQAKEAGKDRFRRFASSELDPCRRRYAIDATVTTLHDQARDLAGGIAKFTHTDRSEVRQVGSRTIAAAGTCHCG
jgi:hypothetical protein